MRTRSRVAIVSSVGLLALPGQARAWSQSIHQEILARAIDTLPSGLKPFYKSHKIELPSLAPDATPTEEGADERFLIDTLAPYPFDTCSTPKRRSAAHPDDAAKWDGCRGSSESYARLVAAFRTGDKAKILEEPTRSRVSARTCAIPGPER